MKRIYNNFLIIQSLMFSVLLLSSIFPLYGAETLNNNSSDQLESVIKCIECFKERLSKKVARVADRSEDIRGILCCLSPELNICTDSDCDSDCNGPRKPESGRDLIKKLDCVEDLLNFLLYILCGIFGESDCASSFCDDVRSRLRDEQNLDGERGKAPITPAPITQQQLDDIKLSLLNYLQNQLGAQSSVDNLLPH